MSELDKFLEAFEGRLLKAYQNCPATASPYEVLRMGEVIHVQFGLEREWEYTRAKTIAGLVSVGAVYGDSEELMTAKAERVLELLRVIVEQIPPVTVTTRLPDGLTDEQIRVLTEAIKKATLHGFESAMTHSVQAFMSAIYDLCTSKLRESQ